ncbi:MAG: hypothetical protein HXX20_24225 [Chloroflexi bacterium]|nr:hypothetical protein [Chloroflexota bacterium]
MTFDPTNASRVPLSDITLRLQNLVAGWKGAERGQPILALYDECRAAAGSANRHLLPARLVPIKDLDTTTLRNRLGPLVANLKFRVVPAGRFEAALVPMKQTGDLTDRWLLAIEEELAIPEQIALYGHVLGHLLLNHKLRQMNQLLPLDPRKGYAHHDTLAELRLLENNKRELDKRVLEDFPTLTALLSGREEVSPGFETSIADLKQRLAQYGWRGVLVEAPYVFTNGRLYSGDVSTRRGIRLRVDALLRYEASLPLAAVQTQRAGEPLEEAVARLKSHAHERLCLPFAYLLAEEGAVYEFDWTAGSGREPAERCLTAIPSRQELWSRWSTALGLTDQSSQDALKYPYDLTRGKPRYYQEAAITRTREWRIY